MSNMQLSVIKAFDIPDAWHKCLREIMNVGYKWKIERGSFEGHERLEFDNINITIQNPSMRPLIPDVPNGVPPPTDQKSVNDYIELLMTPNTFDYQYTYGERISAQMDDAIKMLKETPMTNQCTIEIGQPSDIKIKDPPCLRLIDCRIRYGKLHFFVYFRSWDLWGGFPPNLAGIQTVKEWMAKEVGVEDGTLNAWSKGLHLYDFQWEHAKNVIAVKPRQRLIQES